MNERLKKLRKTLELTQQEFASKIGSVQNTITGYESGRRSPSESVINNICKTFNANETWLRTGDGEMFIEIPEEDQYSRAAAALLRDDDALAIEGLKLYYSLSPAEKEAAANYILKLADLIREHRDKKEE